MKISKKLEKFLSQPNFMVMSTIKADGSIQSSVVWYEYAAGKFRVSVTTTRAKYKNIVKDKRVSLLIHDHENPYQYMQFSGEVSSKTKKGGHDFIDKLAKHYLNKDKYPFDPERKEDRVILTITPETSTQMGFEDSK